LINEKEDHVDYIFKKQEETLKRYEFDVLGKSSGHFSDIELDTEKKILIGIVNLR